MKIERKKKKKITYKCLFPSQFRVQVDNVEGLLGLRWRRRPTQQDATEHSQNEGSRRRNQNLQVSRYQIRLLKENNSAYFVHAYCCFQKSKILYKS